MASQRWRRTASGDRESRLMHDLRSLFGIVHAQAVDARRALSDGDDPAERLDELVGLSALAIDCLRGLESGGLAARPFDLRAAAFLARLEYEPLTLGLLYRAMPVDAHAGALVDLVVAVASELGTHVVTVQQDTRPGLLIEPSPALPADIARAATAREADARALGLSLVPEVGAVRIQPR